MMNVFHLKIRVLVLILSMYDVCGQKLINEFVPQGRLRDISAVPIGDSILFSYRENVSDTTVNRSKWITNSSATPYDVPVNVFAAANAGNDIYLYFLEGKTKARELKTMMFNRETRMRHEIKDHLSLPGTVAGSYVDKNLFVFLLQDKGLTLTLLEIHKLNIVSEKKFKLPVNLSYYLGKELEGDVFYNNSEVHSFKGRSACKIFMSDKIYITIDQRNLNSPWKTTVLMIDQNSNKVTPVDFNTSSNAVFSSFILDGKLFRTFNARKKFSIEIFSLDTYDLISKSELLPDHQDFPIYFRYGRKNVIHMKEFFSRMRKAASVCEPSLVILKNDGRYLIQWGSYFDDNGMMGGNIITMVVGTIILQLMEGPGITRYFYYEWNESENTFRVKEPSVQLTRQKIDNYEISQRVAYKYKNYVEYKGGVAGVYYDTKSNKASVVYFE